MLTLAPAVAFVKTADTVSVFPLALPTELDSIERDARDAFDDFGPADDSPLWDKWAVAAAASIAVCSGHASY